jgi:NAD(P)-dependent dehydrogenase (short-subunit alcohol dehydrogenase family)
MPSVFITGCNRGIGLEFAHQFAAAGWRVHAACRQPASASALNSVAGEVRVHALDIADDGQIAAVAAVLGNEPLDLLINNAGIMRRNDGLGSTDVGAWLDLFRVNSIAPLRLAEALLPALERGARKLIVSITSKMGSIADNGSGGSYAYRSSKAALNMAMKSLAVDLQPRGFTVVVFHPGWVKTDMGGAGATVAPKDSVAGMRAKIAALTPADNGGFFNFDGKKLPW